MRSEDLLHPAFELRFSETWLWQEAKAIVREMDASRSEALGRVLRVA